jgi:hypothetical protein
MKDSVRRIVMLCTILTFGLILIFFDVTLIQLFLMMIVLVLVLPFLLGIATVAEVRSSLANMKTSGILKRLDEMKFFEKSSARKDTAAPKKPEPAPQKTQKAEPPKSTDKIAGIRAHLNSIVSSISSLGTIIKERSRRGKKVEDINKMLDKAVSGNVPARPAGAAAKPAGGGGGASLPSPGGTGGTAGEEADPFLSLSGDEFDAGLLDGLDDDMPLTDTATAPDGEPAPDLPAPELSIPSLDSPGDAAEADSGLDAFSGLEGSGSLDGGDLGELDNLSLDDVELDDDMADAPTPAAAEAPPADAGPAAPAAAPAESSAVKTAWIPSDAPAGADNPEDAIGMQSDMASFASSSGGGSDEDLLSSIASDVKTVKKEADLSLLRELKDFKAPAAEIEDELKSMYEKIGGTKKQPEKSMPPADGTK